MRNQGGTLSQSLNALAKILTWAEDTSTIMMPQLVMGKENVIADLLSRGQQVIGSKRTLQQEIVNDLVQRWPATVDLFKKNLNLSLPLYFEPVMDQQSAGTDTLLQPWSNLQVFACSLTAIIRELLSKFMETSYCQMTPIAPFWL